MVGSLCSLASCWKARNVRAAEAMAVLAWGSMCVLMYVCVCETRVKDSTVVSQGERGWYLIHDEALVIMVMVIITSTIDAQMSVLGPASGIDPNPYEDVEGGG